MKAPEKHSAGVQMASELDVGTTFWFDLPLEQADADELQLQAERRSLSEQEQLSSSSPRWIRRVQSERVRCARWSLPDAERRR